MSDSQGPFDPSHYVEHVTRTALVLEQLARDVKALRDQSETNIRDSGGLKDSLNNLKTDHAIFKIDTIGKIDVNREAINSLVERTKWLSRLIIGALVTGIIAGVVALVFRSINP